MFWMLRGPKLAANFIHNVINNNFTSNGDAEGCGVRAKGYNRLSSLDDEINGNARPSDLNVTSSVGYHPYISKTGSSTGSAHSMTSYQEKAPHTPSSAPLSPSDEPEPSIYPANSTSFYEIQHLGSNVTSPTSTSDLEMTSFQSIDTNSLSQLEEEFEEDTEDEDEELTCNVCDRSYSNVRQLLSHQMRRRHYGCSVCESIFPTWMALEAHKDATGHISDDDDEDELFYNDDDDWDFFEDEEDERERLL